MYRKNDCLTPGNTTIISSISLSLLSPYSPRNTNPVYVIPFSTKYTLLKISVNKIFLIYLQTKKIQQIFL